MYIEMNGSIQSDVYVGSQWLLSRAAVHSPNKQTESGRARGATRGDTSPHEFRTTIEDKPADP